MEEREFVIRKEDIRTMKKDIARFKGEQVSPAVSVPKEESPHKPMRLELKEKLKEAEPLYDVKPYVEEKPLPKADFIQPEKKDAFVQPVVKKEPEKPIEKVKIQEKPEITKPKSNMPEERAKEDILREKQELEKEREGINKKLEELSLEKKPFDVKKTALFKEVENMQKGFEVLSKKEKRIEKEIEIIEKEENSSQSAEDKKRIEKRRWKAEEIRRAIEKERWPWDEKLKEIQDKIERVESESLVVAGKKKELEERQKEVFEKLGRIQLEMERANFKDDLGKSAGLKKSLDLEGRQFDEKMEKISQKLKEVLLKEQEVEENKRSIEEEERATKDFNRRRELEKERWKIEEERRKIESERWSLEEEKNKISNQQRQVKAKIDSFSEKESNILKRIEEISSVLGSVLTEKPARPSQAAPIIKEEKPEKIEEVVIKKEPEVPVVKKDNRIEEARKRIASLKDYKTGKTPEPFIGKKEDLVEKKDGISKERKEELTTRLERRIPIDETEEPKKVFHSNLAKKGIPIVSALPKKPSIVEKLWVRILVFSLVLILLAVIATFWYWYLVIRKHPLPGSEETTQETQKPSEPPKEPAAEVLAMPPLFLVDETVVLEASSSEEIRSALVQVIQEYFAVDKFKRIIIKNPSEDKTLGLRDIFERLGLVLSEDFYAKTGDKFTLFVYSQINGNRIGFAVEAKDIIAFEETSLKNDFNPLLILIGGEGPALVPYFRDALQVRGYKGPNFRYQTLSKEDLGICYTTYGNYFIFTGSWKSMTSVLSRLPAPIQAAE